jgi:hypothetical protein
MEWGGVSECRKGDAALQTAHQRKSYLSVYLFFSIYQSISSLSPSFPLAPALHMPSVLSYMSSPPISLHMGPLSRLPSCRNAVVSEHFLESRTAEGLG